MSENGKRESYSQFEDNLSSKWLLWIGAITMAFGGIFLVKYSIESNIIPPFLRVLFGAVLGLVLTIGGEQIRRVRDGHDWWKDRPDYLPSAVSASGLFILFASVFSSYALYGLISSQVAYISLAIIAFGASYLAIYQGRFFAYLGLIGGMVIPLLVTTGEANEWGLFPYLLVVTTASLWVSRKKAWTDIATCSLGLALLWAILWVVTNTATYDLLPLGSFILTIGGLSSYFLRGASELRVKDDSFFGLMPTHAITMVSDTVTITCYALLVSLIRIDDYSFMSIAFFVIAAATHIIGLIRYAEYDVGALCATFASAFLVFTWKDAYLMIGTATQSALVQHELLIIALLSSAIIALSVFINLHRLLRKNLWAVVGTVYPIINLAYVYWVINGGEPHLILAGAAAVFAFLFALASLVVLNNREFYGNRVIATYIAASTMSLSLALAFALKDAWLTLSLALELVALGYVWQKLKIVELRKLAILLGVVVIARLLFNPAIFGYYALEDMPIINWLFYGYGLTSLLLFHASRLFKDDTISDHLEEILRVGSVLLAIAFVTLEIHVIFSETGHLLSDPTALEVAIQTVNWSIVSALLYWAEKKYGVTFLIVIRKLMMGLAFAGLILGGALMNNIFNNSVDVGSLVIFNTQLLQYLIPGLLYGYKALVARSMERNSMYAYGGAAFLLVFYWLSAEVYHAFHPFGSSNPVSNWESYCYSAVWLAYTVVVLLGGMRFGSLLIRKVGLGLLAFVILKVFLFDMDHLEGIARALSFIGLGGTMIGIGYLYQRMMYRV